VQLLQQLGVEGQLCQAPMLLRVSHAELLVGQKGSLVRVLGFYQLKEVGDGQRHRAF
jgi:hypothetical protein